MAREGITGISLIVEMIYIGVAALCFWGVKRLKKKDNDPSSNQN